MDLSPGDRVEVIDEALKGEVLSVDNTLVVVCCEDGFEYTYEKSQLLKIGDGGLVEFERKKLELELEQSVELTGEFPIRKLIQLIGKKPVIDLHIEELAPNKNFETLHDILSYQLDYVQQVLATAGVKRIRQLVFVHGVGKGILREQLRALLSSKYPTVEYFDGSYNHFGSGATEVIIHQFKDVK
ncbi:MAG: Smr/MutS family protein [Vicingaceae bacterium]